MNFFKDSPTRVIGHRGSPRKALENSFDSFDTAEADGADGFELDVRLTADGEPVVFHDADLPFGRRVVPLGSLVMPELEELTFVKGEFQGRIPTLRDLFLRFGTSTSYLVELKTGPTPKAGLLEFRVAALLTQFHLFSRSAVLSFSADHLRRLHEIVPEAETCLNFDATSFRPAGRFWPDLPKGCTAIGPHVSLASDALFLEARDAGLSVHVWTVNDPVEAARLARLGAASVISDVPHEVGPAIREVTGQLAPLAVEPR
ncbi:MAG: glycerophosphodiester phosphodiesterase [Thermoanaerobaculia bacterium]